MIVLPWWVWCPRWDQESIDKACQAAWPQEWPAIAGAVELVMVCEEARPAGGTRSRVWPHGDPDVFTMGGRCRRGLLSAGVIRGRGQIVSARLVKAWGPDDGLRVSVQRPG